MELPNDVEFVFVDDGSLPVLEGKMKNLRWHYTNDNRPWTQGLARNIGAQISKGDYILFTDIDHILTREAIEASLAFDGSKMVFPRYYGILDENGNIVCGEKEVLEFGLMPQRVHTRRGHLCAGIHGNTYTIKKEIFKRIGGYDSRLCEQGFHMGGKYMSEERRFNNKFDNLVRMGAVSDGVIGPRIYTYPVGKFRTDGDNNPFGLFHKLSLEQPSGTV